MLVVQRAVRWNWQCAVHAHSDATAGQRRRGMLARQCVSFLSRDPTIAVSRVLFCPTARRAPVRRANKTAFCRPAGTACRATRSADKWALVIARNRCVGALSTDSLAHCFLADLGATGQRRRALSSNLRVPTVHGQSLSTHAAAANRLRGRIRRLRVTSTNNAGRLIKPLGVSACTAACDSSGTRVCTKTVITQAANGGTKCPPLVTSEPCTGAPCPKVCSATAQLPAHNLLASVGLRARLVAVRRVQRQVQRVVDHHVHAQRVETGRQRVPRFFSLSLFSHWTRVAAARVVR